MFRPLGDNLSQFTQRPAIKKGLKKVLVLKLAKEMLEDFLEIDQKLLSEELKLSFSKEALIISCRNAYLAQELSFYRESLKERIIGKLQDQEILKEVIIKKI